MKTLHLVDPAVRDIVASMKAFDPASEPLEAFRAQLLASYAQIAAPMPHAREERWVPGQSDVRVLVYRPGNPPAVQGAILYVHGGGYIAGVAEMTDAACVQLAEEYQSLVVSVDYRLAPETPFPGPIEDCYAALSWLMREAPAFGVDTSRVVIMGHSAGGGLAAATALLHRDRGGAPLAGQVLIYPMLDARTGTPDAPVDNPSTGEFGWTRPLNQFAWQALRGGAAIPKEREGHYSPSLASGVEGLPPTFLAVGGVDLFLEEDVAYGMRLSRAGVPVEMHVYPGGIHGFDLFPTASAARFVADLRSALARLLR
ncbi:alpha/beta hydrolase [Corallococcus silvisoli]|uniref:alpha/beta hydrolase n=1 Tax=Corallococcus silvisoli TaxID=2697031 RepID=UPI001377B781|nr:alpha/beta hydrolase [Corallococcus silvisoli]NBD08378.1 alpha/beta hydrolase fold domain-containing protein [Corallococcus silvisoli]